jgi:hypothetical protein
MQWCNSVMLDFGPKPPIFCLFSQKSSKVITFLSPGVIVMILKVAILTQIMYSYEGISAEKIEHWFSRKKPIFSGEK